MRTMRQRAAMRMAILPAAVSFVIATSASGPARAEQENIEEVIVTGSLITRRDFEANSPIVTVDEDLFDQSTTSAIETQLNRLPQFRPTFDNPTQGGDIQPNARNTPGVATVALRGLGANRTLVLINGRRGTPSNASMVMDINTIPPAAIERVEAISGGASATYGADAVGAPSTSSCGTTSRGSSSRCRRAHRKRATTSSISSPA